MDRTGKLIIEAKFEDAEGFSEGLAPVKVKGELVWCPPEEGGNRSGSTMRYGYIDRTGKLVIPVQFESAEPFSEGLAAIRNCGQASFINKTGKTVISGFTDASSFSAGLARVQTLRNGNLLTSYVDKTGKVVWGPVK